VGIILSVDDTRVDEIILHCPGLIDLRLGTLLYLSQDVSKTDRAIGSLSKLKVLRRYKLFADSIPNSEKGTTSPYGSVALRELVDVNPPYPTGPDGQLADAIRRSSASLEVLLLRSLIHDSPVLDLTWTLDPFFSPDVAPIYPLSPTLYSLPPTSLWLTNLTRLELSLELTPDSLELMASLLPRLALVHLGVGVNTGRLLSYVNLKTLKSLYARIVRPKDFEFFCQAVLSSTSCNIEALFLVRVSRSQELFAVLNQLPLKRLVLCSMGNTTLLQVFPQLNLSQLQVLSVIDNEYNWGTETALAGKERGIYRRFQISDGP